MKILDNGIVRVLKSIVTILMLAGLTTAAGSAQGSGYPTRPITLLCPFAAGSIADIETRMAARGLTAELKQPVSVVNVPGASSAIAASQLQQEAADGYTLLMDLTGYLSYVTTAQKIKYAWDDFTAVGSLSSEGAALIGRGDDSRFTSLSQIVAFAKSHPNTLSIAGTGAEAVDQKAFTDMLQSTGITATYIPFNGGSQQVAAILGAHVDLGLTAPSNVMGDIAGKKLQVFAVAVDSDVYPPLPGVTTFKRAGYHISATFLRALYVKKGTSPEIVARLALATKNMLESADWKAFEKRYIQQHVAMSPEQVQTLTKNQALEWERLLGATKK